VAVGERLEGLLEEFFVGVLGVEAELGPVPAQLLLALEHHRAVNALSAVLAHCLNMRH